MIALPSRSCPEGVSTAAADARVNVRAAIASVPSTTASAITSASEKLSDRRGEGDEDRRPRPGTGRAAPQRVPTTSSRAITPCPIRDGANTMPRNSAGRRQRAARLVVDEHGQRDLADPVAELVDRVGGRQLPECRAGAVGESDLLIAADADPLVPDGCIRVR